MSSVDVTIPLDYNTAPLFDRPRQTSMNGMFAPFERLDRFEQHVRQSVVN